ncbi:MAG: ATP-binding cassette domain-containing protein, partial [Clostridia bacterium]|nr:ATP-binding cassette domain-containing protein [Clostridia bacterium]
MQNQKKLTVSDLSFTYANSDAPAVSGASFEISAGELALVCGATGSGKSTLLNALCPAVRPGGTLKGRAEWDGVPTDSLAPLTIGFVRQDPASSLPADTVERCLALAPENARFPRSLIRRRVAETAAAFGLSSKLFESVDAL